MARRGPLPTAWNFPPKGGRRPAGLGVIEDGPQFEPRSVALPDGDRRGVGMDDRQLSSSVRFAAYLVSATLLFCYGLSAVTGGVIDWAAECGPNGFLQGCGSVRAWEVLAPAISGGVLLAGAIILGLLAYRARSSRVRVPVGPPSTSNDSP